MGDFVIVKIGQETKFIEFAVNLGYKALNLLYSTKEVTKLSSDYLKKLKNDSNLDLKVYAFFDSGKNPKKGFFDGVVELCTMKKVVSKTSTHVVGVEYTDEKDGLHQRRSGLNHVILADFKKRGVVVLFDYGSLRNLSEKKKATILGRMRQNISLCKKNKIEYSFVSLAKEILEMKDKKDVKVFQRSIESL